MEEGVQAGLAMAPIDVLDTFLRFSPRGAICIIIRVSFIRTEDEKAHLWCPLNP